MNKNYDIASHERFHIFPFEGKFFVFDVETVLVYSIEKDLYEFLLDKDSSFIENFLNSKKIDKKIPNQEDLEEHPLTNISLNVAQVCNLSCVYCYGVDGEYGLKGKMNEETAFKSIDFLVKQSKNQKNITITFFGGEPMLNYPLIKKCVDYSREQAEKHNKAIKFSITTNGTKFNKEVNKYLNDNKFNVIVSFDGDQETQDKNRPFRGGQGSYEKTLPKIQEFLKSRDGNATARATVTNHTSDLKLLKTRLKEIGFKHANATVATVSEYANDNRGVSSINLEDEMMKDIYDAENNEAREILASIKGRKSLNALGSSKILNLVFSLKEKEKNKFACGVGRRMVGIAINGDVYPCHRFVGEDKFKLGNVDNFEEGRRKEYSVSFLDKHPVCSKCWAKYQCGGGGCIQDNEVMKGDVDNINTRHCSELKHQLKHAINIYSELNEDDRVFLFSK
ncbi:radical SAM/SPASM domain-containing protein [Chryseobacterium lathyri]|jgi:uncharacterized protein|uniref:Nif11-like peptide radical SAM maturase n=1 Tax=Chryseobacterium lathyri TaxID=395933 RepID=A0A511YEQ7_9FLAO|nr:SPASM domain-containing protein [Chryseobacterium lathyri]GEN73677.1 nif11-like peptide radical SAM maturase [Chryseobacterium lathyri]